MPIERRGFLKLGLLGGGVLAVGGVGLALQPTRRGDPPRRPLRVLDEVEFAVLAAAAARVVAMPDADPAELAHRVDEALVAQSPEGRGDFKKLLRLLENGLAGLLLDGRPRNFTALDGPAQDVALRAYRDSRITARRSGYHAIRKLCGAAYYARESTWPGVGYAGPPIIPPGAVVPS